MKIALIIFILVSFAVSGYSQPDTTVLIKKVLCMDEVDKFPEFLQSAKKIELTYFNRWGNVLGNTKNQNGAFQTPLEGQENLQPESIIVYQIKYTTQEGEKKEIMGQMIYKPYCKCG
ncbi:MAG: hypothetical protein H6599_12205 [Flavobacteriales bacterium]|nr:hypothetical protein [Flavobacteriales bacterium]